jgi:hypothetical protein
MKKNHSNQSRRASKKNAQKTISKPVKRPIWKKPLFFVTASLVAITILAFSLSSPKEKPVNQESDKVVETNLLKANGLMSFRPIDIFTEPNTLLDVWVDEAIPLEMYSEKELDIQKHINGKETGIITYAPLDKEKEWLNIDHEAITPYTWKWVKLELTKENGTISRITIRRPNWWIKQSNADKIGNQVSLFLPEMGISGTATVKKISPSQLDTRLWDEERKGDYISQPLTGKFEHESDDVWNYYFQGLDEPIGATSVHPFWSEDRQNWVAVGDLKIGEKVKAKKISTKLVKKQKVEGRQKVYNLEVYREHNFLVTKEGLLVHNDCWNNAVKNISSNRWHHIMNGSRRANTSQGYAKHGWGKLFANPNEAKVGDILKKALKEGTEFSHNPSQNVFRKVYTTKQGPQVEVIYRKGNNGTINVTDAWVKDTQIK